MFTEKLEFVDSSTASAFPIYRVTDGTGKFLNSDHDPGFDKVSLSVDAQDHSD